MRLALLGPALDDTASLSRVVQFLAEDSQLDRAVYLGIDDALDTVIRELAERLVLGAPEEDELWNRAAERCVEATPEQIDDFIRRESARDALKVFESLPGDGTRVIEILNRKVAVMIYDKAQLDEEDIVAASLLAFGKSEEALVKRVGRRWFLSPGDFKHAGVMLLQDEEDFITMTLLDRHCHMLRQEPLATGGPAQLRVQGEKS